MGKYQHNFYNIMDNLLQKIWGKVIMIVFIGKEQRTL
jgi:hypothetical protein